MQRVLLLSLSLVVVPRLTVRAQEPAPPPIVIDGLKALVRSGIDTAVAVWLKGSELEGDSGSVAQLRGGYASLPNWLGKAKDYEILKTYSMGTHFKRTYAIALLDAGPLYFRFDYYLGSKGWVMQHLDFNTDRTKLLPPALLPP
jgi:hypothetical protein